MLKTPGPLYQPYNSLFFEARFNFCMFNTWTKHPFLHMSLSLVLCFSACFFFLIPAYTYVFTSTLQRYLSSLCISMPIEHLVFVCQLKYWKINVKVYICIKWCSVQLVQVPRNFSSFFAFQGHQRLHFIMGLLGEIIEDKGYKDTWWGLQNSTKNDSFME